MTSNLWSDLRYAARSLSRSPGFAAAAMLSLALGIGVNVAMFSLVQQILLRPLPVVEPERLVNLSAPGPRPARLTYSSWAGPGESAFSYPMFRDLERGQEPFVGIAAHRTFEASLASGEQARRDTGMFVSGSYFPLLGLQPTLGRLLGPQDDRTDGQAESVVLSHAYWQRDFGSDGDIVGRALNVNGTPLTIVGVAPPGFHGTTVGVRASVFVPITFGSVESPFAVPNHDDRRFYWVHLFARLARGGEVDEAAAAINPLYRAIVNELEAPLLSEVDPEGSPVDLDALETYRASLLVLEPGARGQSTQLMPVGRRLAMLLALTGVILFLCCANVAGLILVRGSARTGEMAVRASMGATRGRLAQLLLAESLLLTLPAAVASLPVAIVTLRGIARGTPVIPAAAFEAELSVVAAFVAMGIALASALAFGLLPLRDLGRTETGSNLLAHSVRHTSGRRVTRFRKTLATTQIALSMALLAIMGIFAQSLANIARVELGFNIDSLVTFTVSPETSGYAPDASQNLFDRLAEEIAATPGVTSAASSMLPLLTGGAMSMDLAEERIHLNFVSPAFFQTLGIELLAGRGFSDADVLDAPRVAIINRRYAERLGDRFEWGQDVIGQHIPLGSTQAEVVGLVSDAKYENVTSEVLPQLFQPHRQRTTLGAATFYVRGERAPEELVQAVRDTVARIDPNLPVTGLRTMEEQVRENTATERFLAAASTAFAVLATALAGLGLYGVLAYSVSQRSREIALRFALGAPMRHIRGMVLRQVAEMALIGVTVGVIAAWLLGRAADSLLFGVAPGDPVALGGAAAILTIVTLGAAYLPARRAARVDPMSALRYE